MTDCQSSKEQIRYFTQIWAGGNFGYKKSCKSERSKIKHFFDLPNTNGLTLYVNLDTKRAKFMVDYGEERNIEWLVNHLSHSIFRVQASYALHAIRSWRIINNQNIFCQTLKWDYRI